MSQFNRRQFMKVGAATAGVAAASQFVPGFAGSAAADTPALHTSSRNAWKFGLMADTQWRANLDGLNPGTTAQGIFKRLQQQFIAEDVKFVVQVGDLVDQETDALNGHPEVRTLPIQAAGAKGLYDAEIGYFPLRGNHESSSTAAKELPVLYPQTSGQGPHLFGASNFSSPSENLKGLSYSFDVNNVRVIMLDQFARPDGTGTTNTNIIDQLDWIEQRLASKGRDQHAFIFSHKNLIGQNHTDTLFGSTPAENLVARNRFIGMMQKYGVEYQVGGHDHMHHRSVVKSPDGKSYAKELIAASDSFKFYTPDVPSSDENSGLLRETVLAQELWTIGYYIVTVDGPRVSIDFFSTSNGNDFGPSDITVTPPMKEFFWRERWGWSTNGREFIIGQNQSYTRVRDSYRGTEFKIIAGTNRSSAADLAGRPMSKAVNTGWAPAERGNASATLHLWGMTANLELNDKELTGQLPDSDGPDTGDSFVVSLSYDRRHGRADGRFGLAELDADGRWVNAVANNDSNRTRFVSGPWRKDYPLGTYGVDTRHGIAWAVVDHDGVYAVRRGITPNDRPCRKHRRKGRNHGRGNGRH